MGQNAKYQISPSVNEGILEIIFTGEVISSTLGNLQKEVIAVIDANDVDNVLIDIRSLKGSSGFGDAYERVRKYPPNILRLNVAIVDTPARMDFDSFYETTSHNAGIRFKFFTDMDTARDWFKSS
jgi:hypothetical protein